MAILQQVQTTAARMGWKVFPVKDNKHPYITEWPSKASDDETQLMLWHENFRHESSGLLWGLATGPRSGIFILDIDKDGVLEKLEEKYGEMPETVMAMSPTGYPHIYFQYPDEGKISTGTDILLDGQDVRGVGGQAVMPPSRKHDGQAYKWINSPDDISVVECPPDLLADLLSAETDWLGFNEIWLARQDDHIYHWASIFYSQDNAKEVQAKFLAKWQAGGIPDIDESHPWTEADIRKTVASGIKKAKEYRTSKVITTTAGKPLEYYTDLGLSDRDCVLRLANKYESTIRHAGGMGFMVWDGKRWKQDLKLVLVTQVVANLHTMLSQEGGAEAAGGPRHKRIMTFRDQIGNTGRIDAIIKLLARHPSIQAETDDFDGYRGDYKLVFNNGTLDTRTKVLGPHIKEDYLTTLIPMDWEEGKECPTFEQTINWALESDKDLISDLQLELGSALTGADLDRITVLWGKAGDNGKSSILEAIAAAIGSDYSHSISMEALMEKSNPNFKWSALASMKNARFVSASENEEDDKLAIAMMKQLTGGDKISCKHMRGDHFSYRPKFRIILRTNLLPKVAGIEQTIWKRLSPIPFNAQIPADKLKSRAEVDALFREEQVGIVGWLVEGAYQAYKTGALRMDKYASPKIKAVHREWRQASSPVWAFFEDLCEEGPDMQVQKSIFNKHVKEYAKANDLRKLTSQKIKADLETVLGKEPVIEKINGIYFYCGFELVDKDANVGSTF